MAIIRNAIGCKHCGDVIESKSVHDFKACSCGACAVDGGLAYLRRCARNSILTQKENIIQEMLEYYNEGIQDIFAVLFHKTVYTYSMVAGLLKGGRTNDTCKSIGKA